MAARRRRRSGETRVRSVAADQPTSDQPRHVAAPRHGIDEEGLERIHNASMDVLETIGIDMLHAGARRLLADAGCEIDGERVRFDRELVAEQVAAAPASFRLHGREPERDLMIGGDHIAYASVASAPNYVGLDGVRRTGDRAGFQDFIRLGQQLNAIHLFAGYPVEPVDLHASIRHLECAYDVHTLSDKPFHIYSLGPARNRDGIEMVRIARGIDDDQLDREPSLTTIINASSPLRFDEPMLEGIVQMAERGQVSVITPFTLAGAMAPVTLAGALVQQNAEALAGIVVAQLARRGAPVVYGGFTSNVDMRSGSPAFGTGEYAKAAVIGGQLARRYGLPYRSSNVSTSNAVDAQAGYESMMALWGAIDGGVNFLMHGAGWMEGGLHSSYEKMVIDADLLAMVATFLRPIEVDDDALAVDAIAEVGPGGHFFGGDHTQARYKTAFHAPMVSDWRNWESWLEAGRPEAAARANAVARELIDGFEPPPLDDAIAAELRDYVDRRTAEGGAATNF